MRQAMRFLINSSVLILFAAQVQAQDLAFEKYCVDSISKQIAQRPEDTTKVRLMHRLAYHQYWLDTAAAQETNNEAGVLADQLNDKSGQFQTIYTRGSFEEYRKDYTSALDYYTQAAGFGTGHHLYAQTHDAYTSLLNLHFYRGEYVYALSVCLKGLDLAQKSGDLIREATYTNLSGFIYRNMQQLADSEKAYRSYLVLAGQSHDSLLIASACTEMAQLMILGKEYDSSLFYLEKAYGLYAGIYERHRRAYVQYLISQTFKSAGETDSALVYALKAIEGSRNIPANEYDVARYYIAAGEIFVQKKNTARAILLLDTGLQISQRIAHRENIRDAYHFLAEAYAMEGDHSKAYLYQHRFSLLKDSLLNEQNLRTIAEMKARYELDKKEQDIRTLKEKEKVLAAEQQQASLIRNLVLGLTGLILLIGFLFYNRYRLAQKNAYQVTINRQQNEMFQGILSAQEKERQRIAGDLHDGLGSLLSSARLQMGLMNQGETTLAPEQLEHYEAAYAMIDQASRDLRNISHSIMPASLTKLGLAPALENVIKGLGNGTTVSFRFHAHNMEERPDAAVEIALYHITMELLNNILKHSRGTEATVQLTRFADHINLLVEDNGKGFNPAKPGNGIGLSSIRSRIDFLGGTIDIDSSPGRSTTVSIDVPVS